MRWLINLFTAPDPLIDDLIAKRGCQSHRPGMARPDSTILSKIGQRKWTETLIAQRRLYKASTEPLRLLTLRKAGTE